MENGFALDHLAFSQDTWFGSPSDLPRSFLSPSISTRPPLSGNPAIDLNLSSAHINSRYSVTATSTDHHHEFLICHNTDESIHTGANQLRLPATYLLQTRYDGLHASLGEVVGDDADFATRVSLPTKELLNEFIETYFENFSPLFPILSTSSFIADAEHYLLVLCVCTIGASFLADTKLQTLYLLRSLLRKGLDSLASETECWRYHIDKLTCGLGWKGDRSCSRSVVSASQFLITRYLQLQRNLRITRLCAEIKGFICHISGAAFTELGWCKPQGGCNDLDAS